MNCLLCKAQFMSVESLRGHYILEHSVDDNNETFRDMFSPNTNSKRCHICELEFDSCRMKNNLTLLLHYNQSGKRINQLPINILHQRPIKYFIITFGQHKNLYNFDDFSNAVSEKFVPETKEYSIHAYAEIIHSQNNGDATINNCAWVTNVCTGRYFKNYINVQKATNNCPSKKKCYGASAWLVFRFF